MKILLIALLSFISLMTNGQSYNDTIKVIATLNKPGQGSKIQIAEYKVIKVVRGSLTNSTIKVGYYFYKQNLNSPDTALLNLIPYPGRTDLKDYYIFPSYDAKSGIENVKVNYVDFQYWEECETNQKDCEPLSFTRKSTDKNWYLFLPCGGTTSIITLSKQQGIPKQDQVIHKREIASIECPPLFDLSTLEDGKYYLYMLACGLGGQIEINLTTRNK